MSITRVAKLAGVSSSTVSRVINNHPRVAPETADSVRRAMTKLGYTPPENRPGPKPQRVRTSSAHFGYLLLGTATGRSSPGFEEVLHGLSTAAARHGVELSINYIPDPETLAQRLAALKLDGVILGGAPNPQFRARLVNMRCVWLMGNRRRPDWGDQVMPDSYAVGEMAAKYLVGRGHTRCAFMNLDIGHWAIHLYGHAFEGAIADLGAESTLIEQAKDTTLPDWREHSAEAVDRLVKRYLALPNRPTGLFVAEDMQTALLQPALQKAGVEFGPGGVELISCNNERPYLVGLDPLPASIDIRLGSIGARGIEQLLWRLDHPAAHDRVVTMLEPRIVQLAESAVPQAV